MIERRFSIYEIDGAGGGLRPVGMEARAYLTREGAPNTNLLLYRGLDPLPMELGEK
jgi:hypothetical protein